MDPRQERHSFFKKKPMDVILYLNIGKKPIASKSKKDSIPEKTGVKIVDRKVETI
jgi:hypothetical protein